MTPPHADSIPTDDIEVNGREWTYESVDSRAHRWSRLLDEDEYEWNADDVDVVGSEGPVRIVSLELHDEWTVEGLETAGPDYHRPGFTETISSDYVYTTDDLEEAVGKMKEFIEKLS